MTRVKICGITRLEDARAAAEAGAWAIGLIFTRKSPRFVTARQALAAVGGLPKNVLRVGVFMNQSLDAIRRATAEVPLDMIQLHGRESDDLCLALGKERCMKAVALRSEVDVETALRCPSEFILADRSRSDSRKVAAPERDVISERPSAFDEARWKLAGALARKRPKTILAGGLTPENVGDAIRAARPWGVDVSSGVERSEGKKDGELICAFIDAVRQADGEPDKISSRHPRADGGPYMDSRFRGNGKEERP